MIFSYCEAVKGKRLLGCCMEAGGRGEEGLRDELSGVRSESWYCVREIKTCWIESIWFSRAAVDREMAEFNVKLFS